FLVLRQLDERLDDRRVRDVVGAAAQLIEITTPFAIDACRIGEIAFVQLFDERRVAAEQRAAGKEFGHAAHGNTSLRMPPTYIGTNSRRRAVPRRELLPLQGQRIERSREAASVGVHIYRFSIGGTERRVDP